MAEEPRSVITLDEEVEGDRDGTSDFLFCRIGGSVPLKRSGSSYSLKKPPARPLAVSERFGLLFLAHTAGFLVAKTVDVIQLAKDIKEIEEGNGSKNEIERLCVQEKSILNAQIGDVHILAMSTNSSFLAAAVGGEARIFSVPLLAQKKQEPIFTCSIGESGHIKDFLWRKNMENSFIVLSSRGLVYHGNLENQLKDVMDDVEAVDWSIEGNYLAVAKNNVLSILSSEFKEQLNMSLLFQSWTGDSDSELVIKVDSIKWVRSDSIVLGCVQVNENDEEVNYIVQIITTEGAGVIEACSKPVLVSFGDLFHGIVDDIVPSGGGPHLFMSYLEHWDIAIAANRKNTDEHIVLLAWSTNDEIKLPIALEFEQEKFIPRIELQENRDENLLLGIDVDRISIHEKLELQIDSDIKVLSPRCILLCLSCEGKLIMFHVARISEPARSHETSLKPPDDIAGVKEKSSEVLPIVGESDVSTTGLKGEQRMFLDTKLKQITADVPDINIGKELRSAGDEHSTIVREPPSIPSTRNEKTNQSSKILQPSIESSPRQGISSSFGNFMKSGSPIYNFTFSSSGTSTSSSVGSMLSEPSTTGQSSKISSKSGMAGPVYACENNLQTASAGLQSMGKANAPYGHTMRSPLLNLGGSIQDDSQEAGGIQRHTISKSFSTNIQPSVKNSKDSGGFTSSDGSTAISRLGHIEPVPAILSSPASSMENSIPGKFQIPNMQGVLSSRRVYRSPGVKESEPKLSKQFYSVTDMVEELDTLLLHIDQGGGLRDGCTVNQRSLVLSLEEDLKNLLDRFRMCKAKMDEQQKEIQQLQDKRMQVSARQIYMEGLVKQVSNGQYWDIWNCQKLGPEFEVKQHRISKLHHALINELLELERHFNVLELNKYAESYPVLKGRRALPGGSESSRQIHSLHSLYNTVNSQLAAAEQLSGCLSKQMAVLNIHSPPAKRQSVTKELLESIGLQYDSDSFQSPDPKMSGFSPDSSKKISFLSSSSRAVKEHTRRSTLSAAKTYEPEGSRRRRDSLDRSWTRFDPPKTTVKRILQKETFEDSAKKLLSSVQVASGPSILEGFLASQKGQEVLSSCLESSMEKFQSWEDKFNEDNQKKLSKQLSESRSNSLFKWTKDISPVVGSRFPVTSDMQTSGIQSTPVAISSSLSSVQNKMQELGSLADKPSTEVPYIVRQFDSSSMEVGSLTKARSRTQFDASVHNQAFGEVSSTIFPSKIASSINVEQLNGSLNVKSGENGPMRLSTGSIGQAVTPAFAVSDNSHPAVSSSISENVSQLKTVTSRSQSSGTLSGKPFSTTILSSFPAQSSAATSSPPISVSTSSESPASSFIKHFGGSSSITISSVGLSQSSLTSISSTAPVELHSSSAAPFQPQISKSPLSLPLANATSQSPLVTSQAPLVTSQTIDSQPTEVGSKPQPILPSPINVASTGLTAERKPTLVSSAASLVSASSHSLSEISSTSSNLPSTTTKGKDEGLDISIPEEDEMEEEVPETNTMLNLGALGGFAIGPTSASSAPKTNPFGGSLITSTANTTSAAFSLTTPAGELFRPPSFSLPSSQPIQSSQPMNIGGFSGGFSGFGQPAQIGGQQALGSVLGSFGQSRQLGVGVQGIGFTSSGGFGGGGFSAAAMGGGGGFAVAAAAGTGGGFSAVASSGGGFSGVSAGGFAAMASKPGGFAAAASASGGFGAGGGGGGFAAAAAAGTGGGFSAVASSGGGFSGVSAGGFTATASKPGGFAAAASASGGGFASGGFGSFGTKQGSGDFSQFGGTSATGPGKPPAELLMQMRK